MESLFGNRRKCKTYLFELVMLKFDNHWGFWIHEVVDGCYCVKREGNEYYSEYYAGWMNDGNSDVDWMNTPYRTKEEAYEGARKFFT
jgi:hypothetical protein